MKAILDELLALTEQIAAAASEQRWADIEALQQARQTLIARLDVQLQGAKEEDKLQAREALLQTKALDAGSIAHARAQRRKILTEHGDNAKGRRMQKAYGAVR